MKKVQKLSKKVCTNAKVCDIIDSRGKQRTSNIKSLEEEIKMLKINETVQIHEGTSSMGGMFIYEKFIIGEVVKINEKSIRVHMTHMKRTANGKVVGESEMNANATFTFWKTVDKRQSGKNAGKKVNFYKNKNYGIIEVVID